MRAYCYFLFLLLILASCQNAPSHKFQNVALGDNKGAVLSKIGNPFRTYQKGDTLRWVYQWTGAQNAKIEKEIWFKDGHVVYFDQSDLQKKTTPQFVPVE